MLFVRSPCFWLSQVWSLAQDILLSSLHWNWSQRISSIFLTWKRSWVITKYFPSRYSPCFWLRQVWSSAPDLLLLSFHWNWSQRISSIFLTWKKIMAKYFPSRYRPFMEKWYHYFVQKKWLCWKAWPTGSKQDSAKLSGKLHWRNTWIFSVNINVCFAYHAVAIW